MDVRPCRHGVRTHLYDVRARSCGDIVKLLTFIRGILGGGVLFIVIIYIGAYLGSK